ncbi:MAG: SDR family NAD(P)-dependent oxidoreductase, partial [Eubacteriales bacterium]|nr:SDR family NAD(P)-dependent oxidoreductase [Eubacteriales bacterium]
MIVLITGAAGGLGRAMASECARRGYTLFLTDIDETRLSGIQRGITRRYGTAVHMKACDLTSVDSVVALF